MRKRGLGSASQKTLNNSGQAAGLLFYCCFTAALLNVDVVHALEHLDLVCVRHLPQ
jgi:hypothetical protein